MILKPTSLKFNLFPFPSSSNTKTYSVTNCIPRATILLPVSPDPTDAQLRPLGLGTRLIYCVLQHPRDPINSSSDGPRKYCHLRYISI